MLSVGVFCEFCVCAWDSDADAEAVCFSFSFAGKSKSSSKANVESVGFSLCAASIADMLAGSCDASELFFGLQAVKTEKKTSNKHTAHKILFPVFVKDCIIFLPTAAACAVA